MLTFTFEQYQHYKNERCYCGCEAQAHTWTSTHYEESTGNTLYNASYCKACRDNSCLEYFPELWQQTLSGTSLYTHPRKGIKFFTPSAHTQ